jgi:nucleotide-binding universal stress UspA family protein
MIERILIAYDGTEPSGKAFDFAVDLARRYQAELRVLTVAQVPEFPEDVETLAIVEASTAYHQGLLDKLRPRTEGLGIPVLLELAVGHPARTILERAAQHRVDLIVLAHRGHGLLDRWRLGSVTHRVMSYAECPVTVVR